MNIRYFFSPVLGLTIAMPVVLILAFLFLSRSIDQITYELSANSLEISNMEGSLSLRYKENVRPVGEVVSVATVPSIFVDQEFEFITSAARKYVDQRYGGLANAPKDYLAENLTTYRLVSSSAEQARRQRSLRLEPGTKLKFSGKVFSREDTKIFYLLPDSIEPQ